MTPDHDEFSGIPHPARLTWSSFQQAPNALERIESLLLTFELILRVDALMLLPPYLSSGLRDDRIRTLLLKRSLGLGDWHALLQTLVSVLPQPYWKETSSWMLSMDKHCQRLLSEMCGHSPLQTLIALRNRKAHGLNRTQSDFNKQTLTVCECCMRQLVQLHPGFGDFVDNGSGGLLYVVGAVRRESGSFILPGVLIGRRGELLLYDGLSPSALTYTSTSGAFYHDKAAYADLMSTLHQHFASTEIIEARSSPHLLHKRLQEMAAARVQERVSQGVYRREIMISREQSGKALQVFMSDGPRLLFLTGPSGSGKTTLLCNETEKRLQSDAAVIFISADSLRSESFPDALTRPLYIQGPIGPALERLRSVSSDERVVICVDDWEASENDYRGMRALLTWLSTLSAQSVVKVLISISSHHLGALKTMSGDNWPSHDAMVCHEIPPLNTNELLELAESLNAVERAPEIDALERKRSLAIRLGLSQDASIRWPGLAVLAIERLSALPDTCSAEWIYDKVVRTVVLCEDKSGTPQCPAALQIVKNVATAILTARSEKVSLENLGAIKCGLLDETTGRRSPDYERLLASQILTETYDEYVPAVGFASNRLFEFVAAIVIASQKPNAESILSLCHESEISSSALSIASFAIIRMHRKRRLGEIYGALTKDPPVLSRVLCELAILEDEVFLDLFSSFMKSWPAQAGNLVTRLLDAGELRVGCAAAKRLVETFHAEHGREACQILARAFYELDEYNQALQELRTVQGQRTCRELVLEGEIEAAREHWEAARRAYELALRCDQREEPGYVAHALRGLGYVLSQTDQYEQAQDHFERAIHLLENGHEPRFLAEAWADMGEMYLRAGSLDKARKCLEKSLDVNQKSCCVVGIGIAQGLIGEVDLAQGNLQEAKTKLLLSLEIAEMTGNRWRQARNWDSLGVLYQSEGDGANAQKCRCRSHLLHTRVIGEPGRTTT